MITFFKMKHNEWAVKAALYGIAASFIADKTGRLDTIRKLIDSLKGLTGEDLRSEFISALASIIHEENQKDKRADLETK